MPFGPVIGSAFFAAPAGRIYPEIIGFSFSAAIFKQVQNTNLVIE